MIPFDRASEVLILRRMNLAHAAIAIVHALVAAAWFGAMFYSLSVLHPRAKKFFARDEELEEFIASVARGARWKVLSALALLGISGLALIPLTRPDRDDGTWLILILLKVALFAAATGVFCYVSWRLWPARIFATPDELPRIRSSFRNAAITLLVLAGAAMALGIVAHIV